MSQPMKGITCCGDCAYYNMKKHHCTRASDEGKPTDHFYADCPLPAVTPEPGWIRVKERLPELNKEVLVYAVGKANGFIGEHDIEICNRYIFRLFPSSPGQETWSSPRQYFHTDYEITHWMPLPEGPKEEN